MCILIISISPSRPHILSCLATGYQSCCCIVISSLLLAAVWLAACQRERDTDRGRRVQKKKNYYAHLLGGTVCMMMMMLLGPWWPQLHSNPVESAAGTGSWQSSSVHRQLNDGQTGAGAGRPNLDTTCTCCTSCPKYSARSSAGGFAGRGRSKVEAGRAVSDHVCWVSPQPQDC